LREHGTCNIINYVGEVTHDIPTSIGADDALATTGAGIAAAAEVLSSSRMRPRAPLDRFPLRGMMKYYCFDDTLPKVI